MKRKIIQGFFILLVSSFIFGCNSNDDCNCSSVVAEIKETISETNFEEGLVTTETTIKIETEDEELLSTVTLAEDTQFEDKNGVAITETPLLVVKSTKEEDSSTATIKFVDSKGDIVKPTKSFRVGIKAPANANPGDTVKVEVPDNGHTQIQKIIILIVDKNGFVFFNVTINDNEKTTTVIILTLLGNSSTN